MSLLQRLIHRPRQVWVRRALFQVHLWAGLIVGLYLVLIGISGSILVFQAELEALGRPAPLRLAARAPQADILAVVANVQAAHPKSAVAFVLTPAPGSPVFRAWLQESGKLSEVDADPLTGQILPANQWQRCLAWIEDLHVYLLAGERGLIANGIGAACLLVLSLTGIAIWWPGILHYKRALIVDVRRNWKRINFDLHNVVGFWLLPFIGWWAVSGVYFAWPSQFVSVVQHISQVTSAEPPAYEIKPAAAGQRADLRSVLAHAQTLAPRAKLAGVGLPIGPAQPIVVDMARATEGDLLATDYMYFHPATGRHLATWHYGVNSTVGDWFIWLMHPLHFGTSWGLAIKALWAVLGLTLPLLTITGAWMYWNRYLSRKVKGCFDAAERPGRDLF